MAESRPVGNRLCLFKADLLQSTFRVNNQNFTHPTKCQVDHIPLTHHLSVTIITNTIISSQVRRRNRLVIFPGPVGSVS